MRRSNSRPKRLNQCSVYIRDTNLEAVRHTCPISIAEQLIAHIPARLKGCNLGADGRPCTLQIAYYVSQAQNGLELLQPLFQPTFVEQGVKLILKIQRSTQEVRCANVPGVGEHARSLGRYC